MKVVKGLVSG